MRRTAWLICIAAVVVGAGARNAVAMPLGDLTIQDGTGLATAQPYLVSLSVANLDGAVGWYGDVLGFRETRRLDLPAHALRISFLELNGFRLELIEFKGSVAMSAIQSRFPGVDDRAKVQGFGKLGFAVRDIKSVASLLRAKKAKFVQEATNDKETGEKWLMIEDMDGNCIQFFEVRRTPRVERVGRAVRGGPRSGLRACRQRLGSSSLFAESAPSVPACR